MKKRHNKVNVVRDRIDVSEGIDINKTSNSHKCRICQCWYSRVQNTRATPAHPAC